MTDLQEDSVEYWREAERQVSDAYIRLRVKLRAFGAFDTPRAPSGPGVWATTERALDKALARPPSELVSDLRPVAIQCPYCRHPFEWLPLRAR